MPNEEIQNIDDIKKLIKSKYPEVDTTILDLAHDYAREAHQGQTRLSGEPYINHAIRTARKLATWGVDLPTVTAGFLHDVPEDTKLSIEDVRQEFGKEVSKLVEGITKLGRIKYRGYHRYAENLRKMFVAMAADARTVFIKFADRIDNLKSLGALPVVKQHRITKETLEIYGPIAARLGMAQIRGELEDLAFPYAYPVAYCWLETVSKDRIQKQKALVNKYIKDTQKLLREYDVQEFKVNGRIKRKYSLYRKLLRPKYRKDITQIYDLVALRIVVPRVRDCYLALGLVNNHWQPVPHRIKDYISQPKPNGYQSIHTTVFTEGGSPIEFQIRTREMEDQAEYGLAAHWQYKHSKSTRRKLQSKQAWLEQLAKWQKEIEEDKEMVKNLKLDTFSDRIFVFTPDGDVIDLPDSSTPIDFAYHIHSEVGDHCGGAKINSKLSSLSHKLMSGDVVEIVVNKKRQGPSKDWLEIAQTNTAKDKIRAALRRNQASFIDRLLNR